MAHLARHLHHRGREIDVARGAVEADRDAALRLDAVELRQEVDVEVRAAKLAVGDAASPRSSWNLTMPRIASSSTAAKLRGVDRPGLELVARVEQELGAQESCRRDRRDNGGAARAPTGAATAGVVMRSILGAGIRAARMQQPRILPARPLRRRLRTPSEADQRAGRGFRRTGGHQ
jgi:hypothetical protein